MNNFVFDGKAFAEKKEKEIKKKVEKLLKKGIKPKFATLRTASNKAGALYVSMKTKAAERIGVEVESFEFSNRHTLNKMIRLIKALNIDDEVHGIMVQLPLTDDLAKESQRLCNMITPQKDVDGLRSDTRFLPATVSAVLQIIEVAKKKVKLKDNKNITVAVVGSTGMVGRPLVAKLKSDGYKLIEIDKSNRARLKVDLKDADIIVSATGKESIIRADMAKDGVAVIDVGSPKGDVAFEEVAKKAKFITPVPGGVGPVTIACLLENVLEAVNRK